MKLVLTFIFLITSYATHACKVYEEDSTTLLNRAENAFFGEVISEIEIESGFIIKVKVIENFKGTLQNIVNIKTSGTSCRLNAYAGQ